MPRRVIKTISGARKRGRRIDVFDPNAIDGDGDGIVQELTRFERPATPRTISGAISQNSDRYKDFIPEIIDALVDDPSLYDLAPQKIPSVIFDMAGGNADMFNRSRIRNVSPAGQWSEKDIMNLVNEIKIEDSPDGIFTIVAPPVPQIRELIDFDGEFSNIRIPSPEARIRMYKSILENLKPNKNKPVSSETLAEQIYDKTTSGIFIPRGEYSELRKSLGDQYMQGSDSHPFDAIYERFLRVPSDLMFLEEMYQMEYIQVMHDLIGHLGSGRGFDRHGEWANYLAMVHAFEGAYKRDSEKLDQIAFELFQRIMTGQLKSWEEIDKKRGIETASEALMLLQEIGDRPDGSYIDRNTMRQIIGIDDPLTYSGPKTKSLSKNPETIRKLAVAYLHSMVDNNIPKTGQAHSSFVKKKKYFDVEQKSLPRFNRLEAFNPNAIDADGDGLVQDATRFERPSVSGSMGRFVTPEMAKRNQRIIDRYLKGESRKNIAEKEKTTEKAVSWVLNQARKRGLIPNETRLNKPNPERDARIVEKFKNGKKPLDIAKEENLTLAVVYFALKKARSRGEIDYGYSKTNKYTIPPEDKEILDSYDNGSSINKIAKEKDIRPGEVLKILVRHRLPNRQGRMTIPRDKPAESISGSMSKRKKTKPKTMKDFLKNPSLEIDAESLAEEIGFFNGFTDENGEFQYPPVKDGPRVVNWDKHPQFSYDLETGKPVEILASRADDKEKIDAVLKGGPYRTDTLGNHGRGANFGFDGDPVIGEAYSEALGYSDSREELESTVRLIALVSLQNPLVYNSGYINPSKNAPQVAPKVPNTKLPRSERVATIKEEIEDMAAALGGNKEIQKLTQQIVEKHGDFFPDNLKPAEDAIRKMASGEITFTGLAPDTKNDVARHMSMVFIQQLLNELAREKGHDGIVRLALGEWETDTSHLIIFKPSAIKLLGVRKAYSDKSIDAAVKEIEDKKKKLPEAYAALGYTLDEETGRMIPPTGEALERVREQQRLLAEQKKSRPQNPGIISGSMSNENPRAGRTIKSSTKVTKGKDGISVDVQYGDIDISFNANPDAYSDWTDSYDTWVGWRGNYGMRLASAVLMGEPLPKAAGYMGDSEGTHVHDILSTGTTPNRERSEIGEVQKSVRAAFAALNHIHSGKEINTRPIFRGVSDVTSGDELMSLAAGSVVTMPLSAFTSDMSMAIYYATTSGNPDGESVLIEVLPGARVGYAAGEEYLHEFKIGDEWVVDVTENVTQGKFKFAGMSTTFIEDAQGGRRKIKKITLEQIETFDPVSGSYKINTGKSGSIRGSVSSSKKDVFAERIGNIRPIVSGLIMQDEQAMIAKAVDDYVNRNPAYIRRLAQINATESWKTDEAAINPDGSRMSKEQYIKYILDEQRRSAQQHISSRINKYSPVVDGWKLEQLRHNVETMYAASPELVILSEKYGYPQFGILGNQQIRQQDGSTLFVPNEEAHEKKMPGISAGLTFVIANLSTVQPYGDDAFIPRGMNFIEAMNDPKRVLNGQWGVSPETLLNSRNEDPMWIHLDLIERHIDGYAALGRRPDITDVNTPLGTIRHEASHALHGGAYIRALLETLENPNNTSAKERLALLALLMKPSWQAAGAIDVKTSTMMFRESVSDYAASSPPEWLAETLSAALSPSRKTRALLNFNHRAILALIFPEIEEHLMDGDWP